MGNQRYQLLFASILIISITLVAADNSIQYIQRFSEKAQATTEASQCITVTSSEKGIYNENFQRIAKTTEGDIYESVGLVNKPDLGNFYVVLLSPRIEFNGKKYRTGLISEKIIILGRC